MNTATPFPSPVPAFSTVVDLAGAQARLATAFAGHAQIAQVATEFAALVAAFNAFGQRLQWQLRHRHGATSEGTGLAIIAAAAGQPA